MNFERVELKAKPLTAQVYLSPAVMDCIEAHHKWKDAIRPWAEQQFNDAIRDERFGDALFLIENCL